MSRSDVDRALDCHSSTSEVAAEGSCGPSTAHREHILNVLLTSAGRRVELMGCIRADLADTGIDGRVVACDASPATPAGRLADVLEVVPRVVEPGHVDAIIGVVARHQVGLVVPTIDTELGVLAAARPRLISMGAHVLVSGPRTVEICSDKRRTHEFLVTAGLPAPEQWSAAAATDAAATLPYPLVVKPIRGSSSVGVHLIEDPSSLEHVLSDDVIVQRRAPGSEYTVDVWVDAGGSVRSAVPRRRLEVRGGEVSKGVTAQVTSVIDLATATAEALPDAYGPFTIQIFHDGTESKVIEINARFGGGYPLSWEAGARTTRWAIQDALGAPNDPSEFAWREGLLMLRYDRSVFVDPDGRTT